MPLRDKLLTTILLLVSLLVAPALGAEETSVPSQTAEPPETDLRFDPPGPTLQLIITEEPGGTPTAARISVTNFSSVSYRPRPDSVGFYHLPLGGFFYADSASSLLVNSDPIIVRASKGPEFREINELISLPSDTTLSLGLTRWIDMRSLGWVSGDAHVHLRHPPVQYDIDAAEGAMMGRAEGLDVVNCLEEDGYLFTGAVDSVSDGRIVLFVGQEYRSAYFGHMGLLGIDALVDPWGNAGWPLTAQTTLAVRGHTSALSIFAHPVTTTDFWQINQWPGSGLGRGLWVDAGLGALDALEVASYSNVPTNGLATDTFMRLWNAGFTVPASAGSDAGMCSKGSFPLGGCRVYVRVPDPNAPPQALYDSWVDEQRKGRSFATTGPLLTSLAIGGAGVGETLAVAGGMPVDVPVSARIESDFPLTKADVLVNGEVVYSVSAGGMNVIDVNTTIPIRETSWIAVRHLGPSMSGFLPFTVAALIPTPTLVLLEGDGLSTPGDAAYALAQIDLLDSLLSTQGVYPGPRESLAVWDGLEDAGAAWAARKDAPPQPFHLAVPPPGDISNFQFPSLGWSASADADSGDTVLYRLVLATDAAFENVVVDTSGLPDTTWTSMALSGIPQTYWWRVQAIDGSGQRRWAQEIDWSFAVILDDQTSVAPGLEGARLLSAYPNPARERVAFRIASAEAGPCEIRIIDLTGREVRSLRVAAGESEIAWDGRDASGHPVASGTYRARLEGARGTETRAVTILR